LLVLAVLWWVWASYAWLTNAADADTRIVVATMLFATTAAFIAALTVPEAFGSHRLLSDSRCSRWFRRSSGSMRS